MLRCKLNGLLALAFILVPEHLSYSRADTQSTNSDQYKIPQPADFKQLVPSLEVTASVYFPERSQTDETPLITADGSKINARHPKRHRWAALSRNLLKR